MDRFLCSQRQLRSLSLSPRRPAGNSGRAPPRGLRACAPLPRLSPPLILAARPLQPLSPIDGSSAWATTHAVPTPPKVSRLFFPVIPLPGRFRRLDNSSPRPPPPAPAPSPQILHALNWDIKIFHHCWYFILGCHLSVSRLSTITTVPPSTY